MNRRSFLQALGLAALGTACARMRPLPKPVPPILPPVLQPGGQVMTAGYPDWKGTSYSAAGYVLCSADLQAMIDREVRRR